MMHFGHVVGTDKVDSLVFGGEPFAASTVDLHVRSVYVGKQIVGQVGAVVARHLHLLEDGFIAW